MSLLKLSSKMGIRKRKRVGRGNGSGHGTYSCRGGKGQTARSGGTRRPGFEGGQTPYLRKLPKLKGFKNPNYVRYHAVNISSLNIFNDKDAVTPETLFANKLIPKIGSPVKLLGGGTLEKTLTITVHKASKSAIEAVENKKGQINLLIPTASAASTPKQE